METDVVTDLGLQAFHTLPLSDRNNMWLIAGHEIDGTLQWSQPELVLYDRGHSRGHGCAVSFLLNLALALVCA